MTSVYTKEWNVKANRPLNSFKRESKNVKGCVQANVFLSIYFLKILLPFLDRVFTIPEVKNDFLS